MGEGWGRDVRRDISTMPWAGGMSQGEAGCAPQYPSRFPWGGSLGWWLCATGTVDVGLCCPHGPVPVSVQLTRHKLLSYSHGFLLKALSLPRIQRQEMSPQGGFCTQGSWSSQEWCLSPDLPGAGGGLWPGPTPGWAPAPAPQPCTARGGKSCLPGRARKGPGGVGRTGRDIHLPLLPSEMSSLRGLGKTRDLQTCANSPGTKANVSQAPLSPLPRGRGSGPR